MTDNFYSSDIGFEPKLNFSDSEGNILPNVSISVKNGSPELISSIEAIRQWIIKFTMTDKNSNELYIGTGFGTRLRSLYGQKRIGYGYEEAEIERDYREGLTLCPAISQVTSFELSKENKTLNIDMSVELVDGSIIDIDMDKVYTIGGSDILAG